MKTKDWVVLVVAFVAGLAMVACFGETDIPQNEATALRAVMEENFQATTTEDLSRLMATISSKAPDREEFAKESQALFNRTDVYVRLDDFEVIGYREPYANVRIVQTTLPKDEADRQAGNVYYATNSALLPEAETVEYVQLLLKENGKWKVHRINSSIRPVNLEARKACADGKCGARVSPSSGSAFR